MLDIVIPETELWDERNNKVIFVKRTELHLEHSLISISKWEAKWGLPFFDSEKTDEQLFNYIECMVTNKSVDPNVFKALSYSNIKAINDYIAAPMTATTINSTDKQRTSSERVTSELVYYWMTAFNIPHEYEKWHINRLITLIRVCSEKNKPPKKMSTQEIHAQNAARNAARRAKLHSKG